MGNADQRVQSIVGIGDPAIPGSVLVPQISHAAAVTKSDATVFSPPAVGLYVGGTGDVTVRMAGGQNNITFSAVPAGTFLPVSVDQVRSTGTTATLIVRLWG